MHISKHEKAKRNGQYCGVVGEAIQDTLGRNRSDVGNSDPGISQGIVRHECYISSKITMSTRLGC